MEKEHKKTSGLKKKASQYLDFKHVKLTGIADCVCLIESFHLSTRSPILDNFKFWYRLSLIELNS